MEDQQKSSLREYLRGRNAELAIRADALWSIARPIHDFQNKKGDNDNGHSHIKMVEKNIWRLLTEARDGEGTQKIECLLPQELFILSCAACCHDFDKANDSLPEGLEHGEGSGDILVKNSLFFGLDEHQARCINSAIAIHNLKHMAHGTHKAFGDKLRVLNTEEGTPFGTINLRRVAVLLKAADILHCDYSRILQPHNDAHVFPDEIAKLKHLTRKCTTGWSADGKRVLIQAYPANAEQYSAFNRCFDFMRNEEWQAVQDGLHNLGFPNQLALHEASLEHIKQYGPAQTQVTVPDKSIVLPPVIYDHLPEIGSSGKFFGREVQLSEIEHVLEDHRLVTVVGSGGMGKTRLAWEIINRRQRDPKRSTALAFVSLDSLISDSRDAVLDVLMAALNITPAEDVAPIEALVQRIHDKAMLLVLDNCETARVQVASIVIDLLRKCPSLKILATSQHVLGVHDYEAVHPLPPLSVPDNTSLSLATLGLMESYQLLLFRAQMADTSWTPEENDAPHLQRILQLTNGIPLAVEIVAAQVPHVGLIQICNELDETPLGSVTTVDEYDAVACERHRSMHRCLEWSFKHLPKSQAQGFERLGAFAGRFTDDAVGKVCEVERPTKLLEYLVKTSFVQSCLVNGGHRYKLLNFTRSFAREKATISGVMQELTKRHVAYYLSIAQLSREGDVDGDEDNVTTPWQEDWPDMLSATWAAYDLGNFQAVWQFSRALSPFLRRWGLWSERERLNRAAIEAATTAHYWAALVRSLIDLGIILEARGKWCDAAECYKRSLYFANRNSVPNVSHKAMALQHLGAVMIRVGNRSGAERARTKLEEVNAGLQDPRAKARSIDAVGHMLRKSGNAIDAEAKYREALQIRESIGDEEGLARSRSNLGSLLTIRGEWQVAEDLLRASLKHWDTVGIALEQAIVRHHLADLFLRQQRTGEAHIFCRESLTYRKDDPKGMAVTLALLAKILNAQGNYDDAVIVLKQDRELCSSLGDVKGECIALSQIGTIYWLQQRWDDALAAFEASRKLNESGVSRDSAGLGITLEGIAKVYCSRGDWARSLVAFNESLGYSKEAGRDLAAAYTLKNMAVMYYAAQGQKDNALNTLDKAIILIQSLHSSRTVLNEAQQLRSRLGRKMNDGTPWTHLREAEFADQRIYIRNRFNSKRKAEDWSGAASGYESLVMDYLGNTQQMEAGIALNELGGVYMEMGDFARSEETVRRALVVFGEISEPLGEAQSWYKLGHLFAKQRQWPKAIDAYRKSIEIERKCLDDLGEAIALEALAKALIKYDQIEEAERITIRACELVSEIGTPPQKWHALSQLLWFRVRQNDLQGAKDVATLLSESVPATTKQFGPAASNLFKMAQVDDLEGMEACLSTFSIV